jgi:hypothetical protein
MAPFSTMARRVIESFAANIGLQANAAPDHSYGFEFARSGKLSIMPSEDGKRIIISLARAPVRPDISMQMRLLTFAGLDSASGAMIHAGIALNGMFVLAIDIEEERFDSQTLNDCLLKLMKLHNLIS